ncbi:MAG: hypothetical protein PWQ70_1998 [Clostridiales bacterium]|jgi:hypothetical protein|nr:hypothetical protein [Clostridiales bacterium]
MLGTELLLKLKLKNVAQNMKIRLEAFGYNQGDGSDGLSKKVTQVIIENVGRLVPLDIESSTTTDLILKINHIVRKFAHFGIYFNHRDGSCGFVKTA